MGLDNSPINDFSIFKEDIIREMIMNSFPGLNMKDIEVVPFMFTCNGTDPITFPSLVGENEQYGLYGWHTFATENANDAQYSSLKNDGITEAVMSVFYAENNFSFFGFLTDVKFVEEADPNSGYHFVGWRVTFTPYNESISPPVIGGAVNNFELNHAPMAPINNLDGDPSLIYYQNSSTIQYKSTATGSSNVTFNLELMGNATAIEDYPILGILSVLFPNLNYVSGVNGGGFWNITIQIVDVTIGNNLFILVAFLSPGEYNPDAAAPPSVYNPVCNGTVRFVRTAASNVTAITGLGAAHKANIPVLTLSFDNGGSVDVNVVWTLADALTKDIPFNDDVEGVCTILTGGSIPLINAQI